MMNPDHGRMMPPVRDDAGTVWVNTDIITIMANGETPMFHFWYTADEDGSAMTYTVSLAYESLLES